MKKDSIVHSPDEIDGIRKAAALAAEIREKLRGLAAPGMSSKDFDLMAGAMIASAGARSAFLGYRGFPGQICISMNDEVVHGIGSRERFFSLGDLVSIDVGINLGGFIGDTATSFVIGGDTDQETARLLRITREALDAGISSAKSGMRVSDISMTIEKIARSARFGIVREYVGHGCGVELHEPPEIPNYVLGKKTVMLKPGMTLAIEPMFNLGTHAVSTDPDGWTVRTRDGKRSAHFEHMILVTENEPEVLTWPKMY